MATAISISATGNPEIDGLLSGLRWSGTITYSFPDSRSDYEIIYGSGEPSATGFGQAPLPMRSAITYAVSLIQSYTNASIVYAGFDGADIRVAQSSSANPTSYAYYPSNSGTGGDVWFGTAYNYSAASLGNYYFATAIHELGHAFGLKHSQETGGAANVAVPSAHDDLEYSVMSYRSYVGGSTTSGYTNEAYGYPQTYMANDILALQTMYGANYTTHNENTVYTWSAVTGQEFINGVAQLAPGGGAGGSANRIFETVWDGNGVDTYDLSNYTTALNININPGAFSVLSSVQLAYLGNGHYAQGNVYNAYLVGGDARSYIDNAIGGSGNDTIVGNAIANSLSGGAGDDALTGGGGNDTIDGGTGTDTAIYSGNRASYAITYNATTQSFTVADQRAAAPDGTDTVSNVEFFSFADGAVAASVYIVPLTLTATANGQTLNGGPLGDTLDDGGFAVTLSGGAGNDTYFVHNAGTVVTEGGGASAYTAPSGYQIKGTADLDGDGDLDVLIVNAAAKSAQLQLLQNGSVTSTVNVTFFTNWTVMGLVDTNGDGKKDILYQYLPTGQQCTVTLNGTTMTGPDGGAPVSGMTADPIQALAPANQGTDTVNASISYTLTAGIENLTLASGAGNINGTGNGLDNIITGNEGNNILTGGAGIDTLTGGTGIDTFAFASGDTGSVYGKRDIIMDFAPGTDKIDLTGLDADTTTAGTQAFRFLGTSGFDGQAGALHAVYDAAHTVTVVEGDTNGDGVADFGIELAGNKTLTMGDFTSGSLLVPLTLTATANGQTLNGGPLGDTLDDGGFAVTLAGGGGNDTYFVHNVGTVVTESGAPSYAAPSGYEVKGTADLDGDGDLDVLIVNVGAKSAQLQLLQNGIATSTVNVPFYTNWTVMGLVDVNGDGKKDILYQYLPTGQQYAETLNGTVLAGGAQVAGKVADAVQALGPGNQGTDTVNASISYTLTAGIENLTLASGAGNINGTGNGLDNIITGNEGNNILTGGVGIDTLTGGTGIDTFAFASGDTGSVYSKRDIIMDFAPGTDKIDLTGLDADAGTAGTQAFRWLGSTGFDGQAGALHAVYDAAHTVTVVEGDTNGDGVADFGIELAGNKTLTMGDFTSGSLLVPLTLTATANGQTLNGGPLGDTLDDGGFAVTLSGGAGNDTYFVHNAGTVVTEGGGASAYTAPSGYQIKGTADLDGDGDLDVLIVNAAAKSAQLQLLQNGSVTSTVNVTFFTNWTVMGLVDTNGDGKKDILYQYLPTGQQCTVTLNGTTMTGPDGGAPVSGMTADPIQALAPANQGTDTVNASISYTLTAGIENLTLASGAGNINGTGNGLDNIITGNEGNNILTGGAGIDTLTGGTGIDTFAFASGDTGSVYGKRDIIMDFAPGTDKIDLTGLDADTTTAGTQAFRFLGTSGFDGQAGALHAVYDAAHTVTVVEGDTNGDGVADFGIELAGNKTLTMGDFTSGSLLVPLTLTATANGQTLNGGPLGDTLDDGGFAVTLAGGGGNDTYFVHNVGTVVTESGAPSYAAPSGYEVKGTADLDGDGDLDVLIVNVGAKSAQLQLLQNGIATSTVNVPFYTNWTVMGLVDVNGDGKKDILYQYLPTGQQYAETLNGTVLAGGAQVAGKVADAVQALGPGNQGTDTVNASISYTLTAGIENLTLASGAGNINGTGNGLDNIITGNEGNNILTGGAGIDTFVFAPNFGKDVVTDLHSNDILQIDHTIFADLTALVGHSMDDGAGNVLVTVDANNTITINNQTLSVLQQHQEQFHFV